MPTVLFFARVLCCHRSTLTWPLARTGFSDVESSFRPPHPRSHDYRWSEPSIHCMLSPLLSTSPRNPFEDLRQVGPWYDVPIRYVHEHFIPPDQCCDHVLLTSRWYVSALGLLFVHRHHCIAVHVNVFCRWLSSPVSLSPSLALRLLDLCITVSCEKCCTVPTQECNFVELLDSSLNLTATTFQASDPKLHVRHTTEASEPPIVHQAPLQPPTLTQRS